MKQFNSHALSVSDIHTLHIEEWGNPKGRPMVFLHGGPGGAVSEKSASFFDQKKYRVILFDQRGCGKSRPFLELQDNTVDHSVEDMEKIRKYLGIESWIVFGGSYGSTLALCYAIAYPHRVEHLVLRGIFLGRDQDIRWLYQEGAGYFFPEKFDRFKNHIAPEKQGDLVGAYYELFNHEEEEVRRKAAKIWSDWEGGIVELVPKVPETKISPIDLSLAVLECHYFHHHMFWESDDYILKNLHRLGDIPMEIVHGRYDVDCRPSGAYELHKAYDNSTLYLVDASGHSPFEPAMFGTLQGIMRRL